MDSDAGAPPEGGPPAATLVGDSLLQRLFDASSASIVAYRVGRDDAGAISSAVVVAINRPAAEELRSTPEQLLGRDAWELFSPATRAAHAPVVEEVLRTGLAQTVMRFTPEVERWHRTQVVKLADDVFANIAVDMTAERQFVEHQASVVQQALEREVLYRTLFDAVPVGVLLVDAEGRLRAFNARAHEQLGYERDEFARLHVSDIDPSDAPEAVRARVERVRRLGPESFYARHRTRAGEFRDVRVVLRAVRVGGDEQVLSLFEDVSEQRRLAEQLQQAQKLESIGRLAGGVAHDFNNLLTVILGCADALAEALELGAPVFGDDVAEIRRAGQRASDLTRQLLAFARKQVISPVALDLSELVRGSERMLRRLLGEDVDVQVRLAGALGIVRCDPGLVEQVIMNLAVNARDAMPRGGTLLIETADERFAEPLEPEMPAGAYVRLTLEDDGEGMTDEVKAHLFEPFFTTKPQGRGTGLGLATVYGIVKQSQGTILVRSALGKGTRFDVYFPVVDEPADSAETPAPNSVQGIETILLVEDEASVRVLTQRMLSSRGYRVLAAPGAAEAMALSRAEHGPIHLLVTDVIMPSGSGRDVAEAIRRERPEARVLFISGYTSDVLAGHEISEAGLGFLSKPYTGAALAARVRAILDG